MVQSPHASDLTPFPFSRLVHLVVTGNIWDQHHKAMVLEESDTCRVDNSDPTPIDFLQEITSKYMRKAKVARDLIFGMPDLSPYLKVNSNAFDFHLRKIISLQNSVDVKSYGVEIYMVLSLIMMCVRLLDISTTVGMGDFHSPSLSLMLAILLNSVCCLSILLAILEMSSWAKDIVSSLTRPLCFIFDIAWEISPIDGRFLGAFFKHL
nr:hypothetical protein Iba_chr05eCG4560 [Ipomoea batatas]